MHTQLCHCLKKWDDGNEKNENVSQLDVDDDDNNNDDEEIEEKCESIFSAFFVLRLM